MFTPSLGFVLLFVANPQKILTATGVESLAKAMLAVESADTAFFASVDLKGSEMLCKYLLVASP